MKHICLFIILILASAFFRIAEGSSAWITSPEKNVRVASLIVEATVLDIWFEKSSQGISFAVVQLRVEEIRNRIKHYLSQGSCLG